MASTRHRWRLLCAIALFVSNLALAAPSVTPLFYQVTWQGKSAWLLGTLHVGKADFYPLPARITKALSQSSALVLEADVQAPAVATLMQRYGLQKVVADRDTQQRVDDFCRPMGNCQQLARLSPWLQAIQISMLRFAEMGLTADYGVEQHLLHYGKPLLTLETVESQLQLLAGVDLPTQWRMVRESIAAPDEEMQALVDAWQQGNAAAIAQLTSSQLQHQGGDVLLEKMLWQRNRQMAQRLQQLLQQHDSPLFVAVGSAHLAGTDSLLRYLQQAGANVRDCWQETCRLEK
ncbi:TraB/GumN family protein [Shewanella sp. YIC-542]|uniref:TraB/GumN family protein n=1 Tax=Shewanella mytili TaxID=3377111 RepID=UPI00398ED933